MYIYRITCLLDNRSYIGQTSKDPTWRWRRHRFDNRPGLGQTIRELGVNNFVFEVIDTAISRDELDEKEKFYIQKFNTIYPNGFNKTTGGVDGKYSDHSKQLISKNRRKSH